MNHEMLHEYEDMIGKQVKFVTYFDAMLIITFTDNTIITLEPKLDDDELHIYVEPHEFDIRTMADWHQDDEFVGHGLTTLAELWMFREKRKAEIAQEKEEAEYRHYLELKQKYEQPKLSKPLWKKLLTGGKG